MSGPSTVPASATLAGIRADIEETVDVYDLDGQGKNSYPVSAAVSRHARTLLAAVEAVLKLGDRWSAQAAALDAAASRDRAASAAYRTLLSARAQAHQDCADVLREAITAALAGTGKEGGEDG